MRMIKKAGNIVLALVIVLSLSVPVFAVEDSEDIDAVLRSRGYPQVMLDKMPPIAKESLYEEDYLEFDGGIITTYNEESGQFVDYDISADGVMPIGQIPTADLSLVWYASKNKYNNKEIIVKYSYEWVKLPIFRWQDPIAVSWDDSLFEMKDDSFYKVDLYDGHYTQNGNPTGETFTGAVKSEEYGYAAGYSSGVTWYADLRGYTESYVVDKLYGHGEFFLEKKTSETGTSKVYGHYVHPTASTGVNIYIPKFGNFSVSGGGSYDERGNQITFSY